MMITPHSGHDNGHAGARAMLRRLARWLHHARERYRLTRDLQNLSEEDRQRVLGEVGLAREDLDHLHTDAPETLLPRMMTRFGLDPAAVGSNDRAVLRDMQRVCGACTSRRRCRRALAAGATLEEFRVMCPNAGTFDDMHAAERVG